MYWTERTFKDTGKPVTVPAAGWGVNIVYNNNFPERVQEEFQALGQSLIVAETTNMLQELRTLWYDSTIGQIWLQQGRPGVPRIAG